MTNPDNTHSTASHEFQFAGSALLRVVLPIVGSFAGLVVLLQVLNALDWLPVAAPVESLDEVVMRRRFEMTRAPSSAEVIIIGDSSSSIDVEAAVLSELLPGKTEALNQGMFMGIGMDIYGEAAGEFIKHHDGQVRLVVLLITGEQLQNPDKSALHQRIWRRAMTQEAAGDEAPRLEQLLALEIARDRLTDHLMPMALHGHAGLFFGYTYYLRQHLPEHNGSMFENGSYNPVTKPTPPTIRISQAVRGEAEALRAAIPADVKLAVGITPLPDSIAPATFRTRRDELLRELNPSLKADYLLTNLPVRFPNGMFSSPFHLNLRGQDHFTRILARELTALPVWEK